MTYLDERRRGETAARKARGRLGLGLEAPLADILEVVEELAGTPVTLLTLPQSIAGLCGRKQGKSFVFVNGTQAQERQRFTLAHEFGHIELGQAAVIDRDGDIFGSSTTASPAEVQANGFAAEFLVPRDGVIHWLSLMNDPALTLETVVRLARHFHVSASVALYRIQNVVQMKNSAVRPIEAAIANDEHIAMGRRLGLRDCNDTIARSAGRLPRLPRATITHAVSAFERGLLSAEQIARLLEVDQAFVEEELEGRGAAPPPDEPDY